MRQAFDEDIQETIIQHERFISEKQDLVYLLSHDLKNFAGQPQAFSQFYYRYELQRRL
jgi:hypothetical protein